MKDADIQAYITEKQKKISDKLNYSYERVLSNFAEIYNRSMQAEPVLDHEGQPTGEYRFDAANANRANENIGKHIGFFEKDNNQQKPSVVIWQEVKTYDTDSQTD